MAADRKTPADAGTGRKKRAREIYADQQADRVERLMAERAAEQAGPRADAPPPQIDWEERERRFWENQHLARLYHEAIARGEQPPVVDIAPKQRQAAAMHQQAALDKQLDELPPGTADAIYHAMGRFRVRIGDEHYHLDGAHSPVPSSSSAPRPKPVIPFRRPAARRDPD